jgi:hypothetical protein
MSVLDRGGEKSNPTAAVPASGRGFYYPARGRNACGSGTYGTQSNGAARTTNTCP